MKFAAKTKVPVSRSKTELEDMLGKYGATGFGTWSGGGRASISFTTETRRVRLDLPEFGDDPGDHGRRAERQAWRVLLLMVRCILEAVDAKVVTFDAAFMPWIVLSDGSSLADTVIPMLEKSGRLKCLPVPDEAT